MTEFIIIAPLFIFLITGTIQFMGISHGDALLQYANFMACRTGIVHYESIQKNWDSSRTGGNRNQRVIEVMEAAAKHAMAPIVPFEYPADYAMMAAGNPSGVMSTSPIAIRQVRVSPGTVNLPPSQYPYLPVWLTSETEVDMALSWPWVGRAIQAMHVVATPADEQGYIERGFDPFANVSEPAQMASMKFFDMPYIVVKSDAYLDTRTNDDQARAFLFPYSVSGGSYKRVNHNSYNVQNINMSSTDPQPMALPIQARIR